MKDDDLLPGDGLPRTSCICDLQPPMAIKTLDHALSSSRACAADGAAA
jgi:hypothetical protein